MFAQLIKCVATATALSATLLSASATAAPWTFTTSGTISSGYDYASVFGMGYDLTGMHYALTTMVDPEAFQYKHHYAETDYEYQYGYGSNSSPITQQVTIGSVTKTYNLDLHAYNWGYSYMHNSTGFDQAYQHSNGTLVSGEQISARHSVYSYAQDFLDSISYTQNLSYQPTALDYGFAYYSMSNVYGTTSVSFSGNTPTSLTIHNLAVSAPSADVPEPAPLALLGLGMIALVMARRKKA